MNKIIFDYANLGNGDVGGFINELYVGKLSLFTRRRLAAHSTSKTIGILLLVKDAFYAKSYITPNYDSKIRYMNECIMFLMRWKFLWLI